MSVCRSCGPVDHGWRASTKAKRLQEVFDARAALTADQHVEARRFGLERGLELARQVAELEPLLADVLARLDALHALEAATYSEFVDRWGEPGGCQAFTDYVGFDATSTIRHRFEEVTE